MSDNFYIQEYRSLKDFYTYLCDTPFNDAFRWASHESVNGDYSFTKTNNFQEAVDLMRNGWSEMATKLNTKLEIKMKQTAMVSKRKTVLGVAGFQPIVPLYLAGVPANMVSQIQVQVKSKIVNITKLFNYNCGISTETIIEESVKTLQIVRQLEAQGYRVNLSIAFGTEAGYRTLCAKVLIKSASEKLNISKLAFPLVHPSMLRRLMFRYIEVCPQATKAFVEGYGHPVSHRTMKEHLPNEIVLPSIYNGDVNSIKNIESLAATV